MGNVTPGTSSGHTSKWTITNNPSTVSQTQTGAPSTKPACKTVPPPAIEVDNKTQQLIDSKTAPVVGKGTGCGVGAQGARHSIGTSVPISSVQSREVEGHQHPGKPQAVQLAQAIDARMQQLAERTRWNNG